MLHQANILIHVTAGIIGMIFAIIAYATMKGGKNHRLYGRLFLASLAIVILTAVNGVINFVDRPFLSVVTLQAAYMGWTGWRAVKRKTAPQTAMDAAVIFLTIAFIVRFFLGLNDANIVWNPAVVIYILIYLLIILLFDLVRYLRPGLITNSRFWVYDHVFRLTGAFTALFSAGFGTVLGDWAPWSQILPAIASTVWLFFAMWFYPRQFLQRASA